MTQPAFQSISHEGKSLIHYLPACMLDLNIPLGIDPKLQDLAALSLSVATHSSHCSL